MNECPGAFAHAVFFLYQIAFSFGLHCLNHILLVTLGLNKILLGNLTTLIPFSSPNTQHLSHVCTCTHTMYMNMHASNRISLSSELSLHPSLIHELKRQVTIHEMFASRVHSYCQQLTARPRPPWDQELNTGKWLVGIASRPAPANLSCVTIWFLPSHTCSLTF